MQRYFLALGALLLVVVSLVAGEGGPLDRFAGKAPASDTAAGPAPATTAEPAAAAAAPTQVALGSSFGIGDYDAGGGDADPAEDDLGYGEPTMPPAPETMLAANEPSAKWKVPDGSLTDEQLGVEKPTGLAPA